MVGAPDSASCNYTALHVNFLGPGRTTAPNNTFNFYDVTTGQVTPRVVDPGTYDMWEGEASISEVEDWRFGFYTDLPSREIDETVYAARTLLPV